MYRIYYPDREILFNSPIYDLVLTRRMQAWSNTAVAHLHECAHTSLSPLLSLSLSGSLSLCDHTRSLLPSHSLSFSLSARAGLRKALRCGVPRSRIDRVATACRQNWNRLLPLEEAYSSHGRYAPFSTLTTWRCVHALVSMCLPVRCPPPPPSEASDEFLTAGLSDGFRNGCNKACNGRRKKLFRPRQPPSPHVLGARPSPTNLLRERATTDVSHWGHPLLPLPLPVYPSGESRGLLTTLAATLTLGREGVLRKQLPGSSNVRATVVVWVVWVGG